MARIALISLALLALLPAGASATTLATPAGDLRPQPFQSWVDRAAVPTPPGQVTLHLGLCPDGPAWVAACASPVERAIHLGVEGRDRMTLLHELGHLYDALVLTDADRRRFQAAIGRPGPWTGPASTDPPHEQFAEAYAVCARYGQLSSTLLGMYDYVATPRRHRVSCGIIRTANARRR